MDPKPESNSAAALHQILEAKRCESWALRLGGLGLTSLPDELWQLTEVKRLYLDGNSLEELPDFISGLTSLQFLSLRGNRLQNVPQGLCSLPGLNWLDLSCNRFETLPEVICRLEQLEGLDLSDNALTALPPEIGQLRKLTFLHLAGNRLQSMPQEAYALGNLEQIFLHENPGLGLTEKELGLTFDDMIDVREQVSGALESVEKRGMWPPTPAWLIIQACYEAAASREARQRIEACRQHGDTALDLSIPWLPELPAEIATLPALRSLCARGTGVWQLPPELAQLGALQVLDLSDCNFRELPPVLETLHQLATLNLSNCPLNSLPTFLKRMPNLRVLYLHGISALGLTEDELGPARLEVDTSGAPPKAACEILDSYFRRNPA